jgi:hypothetical protein
VNRPAGAGGTPEPLGRRLALTPIGLDVVTALAHEPAGLRLTPLAQVIGSPVSSVQAALRVLLANGLVRKDGDQPPAYRLTQHPATDGLVDLAILLPDPAHVLGLALRASSAVRFAVVDRDGFVAAIDGALGDPVHDRLLRTVGTLADRRPEAPPVQLVAPDELARLVAVSIGSRARLASAVALKGTLERITRAGAGTRTATEPTNAESPTA